VPYHADWKDYPDVTTPVTSLALEYIESGITAAAAVADGAAVTAAAAIPKALSGVATDKVPVYNGTSWVAQKIVNAQIDAAAAIDVSKLAGAFQTYTPTWSADSVNPAIGDGTKTGKYIRIGNLIFGYVLIVMGSTTTYGSGNYSFSLPVSAENTGFLGLGVASILDNSPFTLYQAYVRWNSQTTVQLDTFATPADQIDPSVPITFAASDAIRFSFIYEAD